MVPEKMLADSAGAPDAWPSPAAEVAEKVSALDAPRPCTSASLAAIRYRASDQTAARAQADHNHAAPVRCLPLPPDIRCRSRTSTSMPPPTPRLSIPGASKAAKECLLPPPFAAAAPRGRSPPTPERRPSSLEPRRGLGSSPQGISCLPQASPSGCLPGLAVRWVPPASPRSLWRSARCRRSGAAASTASPRAPGGGQNAGEKFFGPIHGPGPLGPV